MKVLLEDEEKKKEATAEEKLKYDRRMIQRRTTIA